MRLVSLEWAIVGVTIKKEIMNLRTLKMKKTVGVVVLSLAGLVGCVSTAPMAITAQYAGQSMTLQAPPQKVVVQDLALLDIFQSLAIPVAGVPSARYPQFLAQYEANSYVKTGSLFEPDEQVLRELNPDLIVVGRRSSRALETVQQLAPTVDLSFDQEHLVQSVKQTTWQLGQWYGKEQRAAHYIERLDTQLAALRQTTAQAGTGLLLLTTNNKLIAQGPQSRYGVIFNEFGVQPALTDFPEGKGVELSIEDIERINPDWIYVIDRDAAVNKADAIPAQQLLKAVAHTQAERQPQLIYLDPAHWYLLDGAGLEALLQNMQQIQKALQHSK